MPLFSGFMHAAIGSCMARVIRLFDMGFAPYPPFWITVALALAIYVGFFSHQVLPDFRLVLFAATVVLYARTRIWFSIDGARYWMPLPLAASLASFFVWVAENVGTFTATWTYPGSESLVSIAKLGSCYLLLYVSFALVTLVFRDALKSGPECGQVAQPQSLDRST